MTRSILTSLFVAAAATLSSRAAAAVPDFDHDIRPIIAEHCLECHSLDKAKGGLALVSSAEAHKKLKSGAITIVPGNPDASELVKRVVTKDEDDVMPPKDKTPLTLAQIETLKQWVAAGGDWPAH